MAKRRYDYITINGERFKLDMLETVAYPNRNYTTIYEAYGRPSSRKVAIWHGWASWFLDNNGFCWVSSHNCNFFTIEGMVQDAVGTQYYCRITPSHNYCWKIA